MDDLIARMQQTYPDLTASPDVMAANLAAAPIGAAHYDDVMLAWAAGFGSAKALATLEQGPLQTAVRHISRRGVPAATLDEASQHVRVHMFAPLQGPPPILSFRGRGPLQAFWAIAIFRAALPLLKQPADRVSEQVLVDTSASPELATMQNLYGAAVRTAVIAAWHALDKESRFIIGLELHHQLSFVEMATILDVHRVNAARQVARAKARWLAGTRRELAVALHADDSTIDSVLRLVDLPVTLGDLPTTSAPA